MEHDMEGYVAARSFMLKHASSKDNSPYPKHAINKMLLLQYFVQITVCDIVIFQNESK